MLVVFLHANYMSLGGVELKDIKAEPYSSFVRVVFELLSVVCVNLFILISGWFGIKPTIKGGLSFIYQVLFFAVPITIYFYLEGSIWDGSKALDGLFFRSAYWFPLSYLLLYVLSPALNSFVSEVNPKKFWSVLLTFFLVQSIYGWIGYGRDFNQGQSVISLIGLYLLARGLRLYPLKIMDVSITKSFLLYVGSLFIPLVIFYLSTLYWTGVHFGMLSYISPFVIVGSVYMFNAFTKMRFQSSLINYVASSVFSIYLLHHHPFVVKYFVEYMRWGYNYFGGAGYIVFVLLFTLALGIVSVLLDKVRIWSWKLVCSLFLDRLFSRTNSLLERGARLYKPSDE